MSASAAFAVVLAALAGLGGAVQAAVMGELGDRVGIVPAVAFSTLVSVLIGVAALLVSQRSVAGIGDVLREPAWLWIGGAAQRLHRPRGHRRAAADRHGRHDRDRSPATC